MKTNLDDIINVTYAEAIPLIRAADEASAIWPHNEETLSTAEHAREAMWDVLEEVRLLRIIGDAPIMSSSKFTDVEVLTTWQHSLASWWDPLHLGVLLITHPLQTLEFEERHNVALEWLMPYVFKIGYWKSNMVTVIAYPNASSIDAEMHIDCEQFWTRLCLCEEHGWHSAPEGCFRCWPDKV